MKKSILLIVFAFAAVSFANAQVGFGIKGGLNFANVSVEDALEDPDSKTGFHAGVFAEIGLAGIAIQPELLFSVKGADDFDLTYVEVPILIKKNFAKVFNIHLGPQFGFLTDAEFAGQDASDFIKSTDVSAVVGAGLNLPAGIGGGLRYVYGLSDIDDGLIDTEVTNRTFQVYLSYKFAGN